MNVDTLSIARDLRATELPVAQAEAIAAAIGRSVSEGAATKSDIELIIQKIDSLDARLTSKIGAIETQLTSKIESIDAQLTSKIDNARFSLLVWLMGVVTAAVGIIIAVLKF